MVQSTGKIIVIIISNPLRNTKTKFRRSVGITLLPQIFRRDFLYDAILGEEKKGFRLLQNHTIRRILPDGQLDNSYVFTDDAWRSIHRIALQQDGKVIAGVTQMLSTSPFTLSHTLQRFTSSGQLYLSFHAEDAETAYLSELMIRKNGKIVVAGFYDIIWFIKRRCI